MSAWFDEQGQLYGADRQTRQVWVPATQVLLTQVQVSGRHWRNALPWALEPQLMEPVESVHIAVLHRTRDGLTYCAIVSHARMRQWLEGLQAAGCSSAALVPDCFQLPEQTCVMANHNGDTLVRQGKWSGWRASASVAEALRPHMKDCKAVDLIPALHAADLSLRQGAYAPWGDWMKQFRQWRRALMILVAFVVVMLAGYVGEAWQAERQAQAYVKATEHLFHSVFGQHRLVDLRAQTEQLLRSRSAGRDLWMRLAKLQPALTQAGLHISKLSWENHRLILTVISDREVDWERLRQVLPKKAQLTVRSNREAQILEGVD